MPSSRIHRRARLSTLWVAVLALGACADQNRMVAWWNELRGDPYALDEVPREVAADGARCADLPVVVYGGDALRYDRPLQVAEPFRAVLASFEDVVAEVATAHYGRPPETILHFGARACRTVRGSTDRLSEHALGNALDVSGFRFGRLPREEALPDDAPARLRRPFTVSVRRHFPREASGDDPSASERSTSGRTRPRAAHDAAEIHAKFFTALVAELEAREVFRGMVGPGHAGHEGHLHLDMARGRYRRL